MKSASARSLPGAEAPAQTVAALAALAQPTRLALFRLLLEHEPAGLTPGAIAARLGLAAATLSFHLKELAGAGLVVDRRAGRFIWYRANVGAVEQLVAYLTETCCRAGRGGACAPARAPGVCAASTPRKRKTP